MTENEKAERASALLSDALLQEVIAEIRNAAFARFESSPLHDDEGRKEARMQIEAAKQVVSRLQELVDRNRDQHRE